MQPWAAMWQGGRAWQASSSPPPPNGSKQGILGRQTSPTSRLRLPFGHMRPAPGPVSPIQRTPVLPRCGAAFPSQPTCGCQRTMYIGGCAGHLDGLHHAAVFSSYRRPSSRWRRGSSFERVAFSIERGVDRGEVLAAKKKTEQEHCNLPNGQGAIAAPCRGAERGTLYSS